MTPELIADVLFTLIEKDQGDSYFSGGVGAYGASAEEIIRIAAACAQAHERTARKIKKWIRQQEQRKEKP